MSSSSTGLPPKLALAAFIESEADTVSLQQAIERSQVRLTTLHSVADFITWVEQNRHELDGIILQATPQLPTLIEQLYQRVILLLPAVILCPHSAPLPAAGSPSLMELSKEGSSTPTPKCYYHQAEVQITESKDPQDIAWEEALQQAISDFLKLRAKPADSPTTESSVSSIPQDYHQLLGAQQHRLAEKLRARLGYLGVYYKREESSFFRNLSPEEQDELTTNLQADYREIVIGYFDQEADINIKIDNLVDKAFFADISVAKIVEMHIALMDELSKQLKLEGRSPEILLDYRLTLIDVISHLGEMYRRSIPRER